MCLWWCTNIIICYHLQFHIFDDKCCEIVGIKHQVNTLWRIENDRRGRSRATWKWCWKHSHERKEMWHTVRLLGTNSLKKGAVWRNRPMRELLKSRNFKERDCATVAESCRVLPPLPSPLFAPRVARLHGNTGWRNSKEGPHNLSDVTRKSTRRCILRMSDSSVHRRDRS
jgi:hypothetical protein